ncbi:MAG: response regulator [Dehalococcoidia bacterium]
MVIEDDEKVGKTTCRVLEYLGCDALWTSNGEDGLREVERKAIDLVLVDFGLPGRNGISTAGSIHEIRPAVPIVLVTGWLGAVDQAALEQSGIAKALTKPVTKSELAALLDEFVHR